MERARKAGRGKKGGGVAGGIWWHDQKQSWYFGWEGRKISLRTGDEADATRRWHKYMADPETIPPARFKGRRPTPAVPAADLLTLEDICSTFLSHQESSVSPGTYATDCQRLKPFREEFGRRLVSGLDADEVSGWATSRRRWGQTSQHEHLKTVCRAFAWAAKVKKGKPGLIASSPLAGMDIPAARPRGAEAVIDPDDEAKLLAECGPELQDLVRFMMWTGCRPGEVRKIEASMIEGSAVVLRNHKTAKKTNRPRIIPLIPEAVEVLNRLSAATPTGPLFRTKRGLPWRLPNMPHQIKKAADAAGVRFTGYFARHSAATRMLEAGVPDTHVASVLGHVGTTVLHQVYSHLGESSRAMLAAASVLGSKRPDTDAGY